MSTARQQRRLVRVQEAAAAHARARKQLDRAILSARADGLTLRAIGDAANFTHRTILQIVERHAQ